MEPRQPNKVIRLLRSGLPARLGILIIGVPTVLFLLLGVVGAIDGALDRDCQVGLFSACGPDMRALAYVGFVGFPLVALYYAVLGAYGLFLAGARALEVLGRLIRTGRR